MNINDAINKSNSQRGKSFYSEIVTKYASTIEEIIPEDGLNTLIDYSIKDTSFVPQTKQDNTALVDKINKLNTNFEKILKKLEDLERKEAMFNKITDFEKRYEQISLRIEVLLNKFNIGDDIYTNMNKLNNKFDKLNNMLNIAEQLNEFDNKLSKFNNMLDDKN
jgi:uncharacterized coiled-coil DUF342 family protein